MGSQLSEDREKDFIDKQEYAPWWWLLGIVIVSSGIVVMIWKFGE